MLMFPGSLQLDGVEWSKASRLLLDIWAGAAYLNLPVQMDGSLASVGQ